MDHERQSMDLVIREKWMSSFQLYTSLSQAEIDCISIREGLVAGCIPILSDFGVFKYREGIHIKNITSTPLPKIVETIIQIMHNTEETEQMRLKFRDSPTITSWDDIANSWMEHFVD